MCQDIVAEKEKGEEETGSAGGEEEEEDEEEGGVEVWVKWFGDNQLSKVSPSLSVCLSAISHLLSAAALSETGVF